MTRHHPSLLAFRTLFLAFAFLALPLAARAQSATATLSGTITDENNAVVPGTQITVLNVATSMKREATTNDDGYFVILLLPPGNYTVRAQHDGFKAVEVREIILNVNDERLLRIQMNVGNVTEVVDVTGEVSLIDESPVVGTVVNRQFVENMPLNGRSFQSLITLAPGVVLTKSTPDNTGQFSVNGQRQDANYFTVDGVSANIGTSTVFTLSQFAAGALPGVNATGGTSNLVSVDALEEFKILTSTFAPEFGRTPGGQVAIVTRSGSKDFHGNLFNYLRNEALDANDWFANRSGLKKAPLRQNDFGGTISGPIFKNRTFFFFSYEGLRLRLPQTTIADVPSLATRQNAPAQLQPFLNAYPTPNGSTFANGMAEFTAAYSNPSRLDATSIRIDQRVGDRHSLFGRYNNSPSSNVTRSTAGLSVVTEVSVDTQTLTGGLTSVLTKDLSNEFRANWSRVLGGNFVRPDAFGGGVAPSTSFFFPTLGNPETGIMVFFLTFGRQTNLGLGKQIANTQRQINIVDNLSYVLGRHQFKFGADYRRMAMIYAPSTYVQQVEFNSVAALNASTASVLTVAAFDGASPVFTNFSAFAQDTWKATPRLTLTYGLRWEVNPAPAEEDGKLPRTVTGIDTPGTMTLAPEGTRLWETTYANFAPRFGIGYQLSTQPGRETILRGGVGIFYDMGNAQGASGYVSWPFQVARATANVPFPFSTANATPPPFTSTLPANGSLYGFVPGLKLPRTYQWNVAIEQSLGKSQTMTGSYVAALGRRMLQVDQIRSPLVNPALTTGVVLVTTNKGTSDYHSMQLQFQRRLTNGLQALASYAWAKSIDTASTDLADLARARGPSNFDVRHVFTGAATYNIPMPVENNVLESIFGDWSIDTIVRAQSATPVNVLARSAVQNLAGTSIGFRPDLVPGVPLYLYGPTFPGGRRINPAAFALPPVGPSPFVPLRQGTLGRNALRGFPLYQVDFSLRRQFQLNERLNMLFRADIFNIFNHPNFADPNGTLFNSINAAGGVSNPNFGLSQTMLGRSLGNSNVALNPLYQVGGPRSIQLSLKLSF